MNNKLSNSCEKEVFKVKKQEVFDNTSDYALITLCADAIEQFCTHHDKENVFECLRVRQTKTSIPLDNYFAYFDCIHFILCL